MRAAQFLAIIGRGSKGSNALENTEDRAGATSEQQDNVINTVNSLDPYGPSWQLVPGNVAAGTVYAQVPTSGTGDLTFTRASTATRTNSAGNIVDVASGVGRIHYRNADGSLSSTGRLLLDPQRTNSIRNSTMVGAVAGTPGTLPTNWGGTFVGLTRSVAAIGVENGLQYIDLRFVGTAVNTFNELAHDSGIAIAALTGQAWSYSIYLKTISGPNPPTGYALNIYERNSAGGYVTNGNQNMSIDSTLKRYTQTRTLSGGATVAFVDPRVWFYTTVGATYDFTIRIAAPQMELGAFATTFIKTSTAAVTRLIDTPVLNNAAFLPTAYPFTLFADMDIIDTTVGYVLSFSNNAAANNYFAIIYTTNIWSAQSRPNGTTVSADGTFTTARGRHKAAAVFTLNTIKIYVDGVSVATATNTQPFNTAINDLNVGLLRTITDNGVRTSIFQSAVFNRELTNAELAAITTL
jgi:hypothetical protein